MAATWVSAATDPLHTRETLQKVNADGTYEATPLTGYATTRTENKTNLTYTAWSGFASKSCARQSKTVAVAVKRAAAAANRKAEKLDADCRQYEARAEEA
jgi:hypothetical protein